MKFNRRQILLGGVVAGVIAKIHTQAEIIKKNKQLQDLAKQQVPKDPENLLKKAFEADAQKIYQGQQIIDSLKLTPPNIPYDRQLSKLLIQYSKIATQQYLTGKTIPDYDGSINTLPAYSSNLDGYTQIASFRGQEAEISENVTVDVPSNHPNNFTDPLQENLDQTEAQVGQIIQTNVKLKKEIPVYLGFVLCSPQNNIIVFRGTQTSIEWFNNFTALQEDYTDPLSGKYFGKIHKGFMKNYLRIIDPLPREIAKTLDPKIPCYITGHSLGASLAILAALDISINVPQLKNQIQLYTYASPRVGDPTFARLHSTQVPNSYRVANLADAITFIPPTESIGTYVDVGQEWSFLSHQGDFMPNHVVDTYKSAIDKEVETNSSRIYPVSGLG
jgi:predicted lipase